MVLYEKKLDYNNLLFASIGHIIGAGIFFIIKYVYGYSKEKTWMSIFLGGLFMLIFGNIYADLPKKYYNIHNIEHYIIEKQAGTNISKLIILLSIIGLIFGGYIVGQSFSKYFSNMTNISEDISFLLLIGLCFLLNVNNIDILANINTLITIIGIGILIFIILVGFYKMIIDKTTNFTKYYKFEDMKDFKLNIWNIIKGAYIIIFSYLGFEVLIRLNKESVNSFDDIPRSIKNSLYITILIYSLLGIVYAYSMNKKKSNNNNNNNNNIIPITNSIEILLESSKYNNIINIAACIFTANTVLLIIMGSARLLDGIINIDKEINVPKKSIILITLGILTLYFFRINIKKSIFISNTFALLLFISVIMSHKLNTFNSLA
jgi:amino acid transporter